MNTENRSANFSNIQTAILVFLRMAIGWHFLFEGLNKVLDPSWSSAAFLSQSRWILAGLFKWIVANPTILDLVDALNAWGLTLIGLGLLFGAFTRAAALSGMLLLALYYAANPPFIGFQSGMPTEGSYLIVDKNMVELLALAAIALIPAARQFGLDPVLGGLWAKLRGGLVRPESPLPMPTAKEMIQGSAVDRRELVKALATAPVFGGFVFAFLRKRGWDSYEERNLLAAGDVDTVSSATIRTFQYSSLKDLKGKMTYGKIGDLELSRMILGGNLMGGWAHARDLIYVSKLVKSYHTDEKIFDTFGIAEACGVNTILTNPVLARVINAYWRKRGGKIKFISDCALGNDLMGGIKMSVDGGAHACYVQGGISDRLVADGKLDDIAKALEAIRSHGIPAGIGGHKLETVKACVDAGLIPDFWVKTLHHIDYWSAKIAEENDNIWCTDPPGTVAYMNDLEQPWIAFKILAAGAIEPKVGFRYAFESGADFICVGMYDFQIVDDVNLACDVLASDLNRTRVWRA